MSIYLVVAVVWTAVALAVIPYLLLRPAPYGRHARPGWGKTVPARLAWLLMEAPSPLGMTVLFVVGSGRGLAGVVLAMWLCHYLYRAFVYPFLLPTGARPMPVVVLASGEFFNLVNVYLNGYWSFFLAEPASATELSSPRFLLGALLFFCGLALHVSADRHLRRLRSKSGDGYALPRGPLFALVSCPNYLGEIIEWSGFALVAWSPGGLLFLLWTIANLVPRAIWHHRFYRARFPDYPRARRAVIPFVL
jgi:3-oxo-5-alpha-steroid 4-dehydrogenase 1